VNAPSRRYPTLVGPNPAKRARKPSSLKIVRPAITKLLSVNFASTCFRVFMTSIGVGMACDIAAHNPPDTK